MAPTLPPIPHGSRLGRLPRLLGPIVVGATVAACATVTDYNKDVVKRANDSGKGPQEAPALNATGFAPALRCMDITFLNYGVKNLTVLIEDVPDSTKKVNASGKDMIISAMSQMTRRSRAVNLMAFSINDQTLGAVIGLGTRNKLVETPPDFTIRGSVSQFDENVVRKQGDVGIGINAFSAGYAKQGTASVLAVDLSVINTTTLNLVAGVTSKNSVLVLKSGTGADGEVNTSKYGLNFSFVLSQSEGTAQALRTLTELASIELIGKLTKVPYWTCIGAKDDDPGVMSEITDWWETMAANPISLVAYFQQQMIARGLYAGEVNGQVDDALLHAIEIYQRSMGRESSSKLNFEFFRDYLRTDHAKVQEKALALLKDSPAPPLPGAANAAAGTPAGAAPASPAGTGAGAQAAGAVPIPVAAKSAGAAASLAAPASSTTPVPPPGELPFVYVSGVLGRGSIHRRGQPFEIDVAVDQDSNLYCYLLDENRRVNQFFPNPAQPDPRIKGGTRMQFPGQLPFRFVASARGEVESIACFATAATLGAEPLKGLPSVRNTQDLKSAFLQVGGPRTGVGVYDVKVQ
jgi:hypothetical protein